MVSHKTAVSVLAIITLLWSTGGAAFGAPPPAPFRGGGEPNNAVGTAITYQGRLTQGDTGVSGNCDLAFRVFDAAQNGQLMAQPITTTVAVINGLFTVALDFGASAFTGDARYLETRVRCPAGSGGFTTLDPRTTLTAAPYALSLRSGAVISGTADTTLKIINNQSDGDQGLEVISKNDGIFAYSSATYGYGLNALAPGDNGTGVYGSGGSLGVYGLSDDGTGVYARSDNNTALLVEGHARQTRTDGGLVKALVRVNSNSIDQCFNGQVEPPRTDAAADADCGFSLAVEGATFTVTLGFTASDRFFSITPLYENPTAVHVTVGGLGSNYVVVRTWNEEGLPLNSAFYLTVY